jgi:hypothetical protein
MKLIAPKATSCLATFNRDLPTVFTRPVLLELARSGRSNRLARLARKLDLRGITYSAFFDYCFHRMVKHYRAEYVYKNAIVSKILLGRHSLNTTRYFAEFRVGKSRADVVLVNGTSTAYEIKTELDSMDRLDSQLSAYRQVFDQVFLVTHDAVAEKMALSIHESVGILLLTRNHTFSTYRAPRSNRESVQPAMIFDSLRRDEYREIIKTAFGRVPEVPNTKIFSACKKLFRELEPTFAHDAMVKALKKRYPPPELPLLFERAPKSIRAAALSAHLSGKDIKQLAKNINLMIE